MIVKHYKGGKYQIIGEGLVEATLEPVVIYKGIEDGLVWTRPMEEFYGTVQTVSGGFMKRFEEVADDAAAQ